MNTWQPWHATHRNVCKLLYECGPGLGTELGTFKGNTSKVSRECSSTIESTFDVNVSRELQLELYSKYRTLLDDMDVVFC